jgi:flagellar biosynthesis protein
LPRLPRNSAVALRYHPQAPYLDAAPRLVAKGEGLLADRILQLARANNIPVERDPNLLAALEPLQVDRVLPPELFKAVAILLAALYRANGRAASLLP